MQASTIVIVEFLAGLFLLIAGAELLVRGSVRLARAFRVPALIIGLTVVAYGTGSPELAVSIRSSFAGQADIAIGNVVGSNIFNILFILGLSSLLVPLVIHEQLVRVDVPIMIGASAVLYLMAIDGVVSRLDGIFLIAGIIAYTTLLLRTSGREPDAEAEIAGVAVPADRRLTYILASLGFIAIGLTMLVVGSNWLVEGAVVIARTLGVSELVIGLTIVAAGTSLPEVATSVVAGIRGQRDIAAGNVVGSNIFNILMVAGVVALITPGGLPVARAAINFDLPVMLAVAVAVFPIVYSGRTITRWQGGLFLCYWIAYTAYVILLASRHDALPAFSAVMTLFVLPITGVALLVLLFRELRQSRRRRH